MNVLALHLKAFTDYAELRGISSKKLGKALGHPLPDLDKPDLIVDGDDFVYILETIVDLLKDDKLGIRVGNHLNLKTLGAIFSVSLKSTTVQEALFYCQDYLNRTLPLVTTTSSRSGNIASIVLSTHDKTSLVSRVLLETMLTVISREIQLLSGEATSIGVTSPYYKREYPNHWKKGEMFSVNFQHTILKATLQNNQGWGLDTLIPQYLSLIEAMRPDESFSRKIRVISLKMASPVLPDIHMVCDVLNLTPRTLQRRLSSEGNNFKSIMKSLKHEITGFLIRHHQFSITNMSYLLGYSEPAAFIRSFKKEHGSSPRKLRQYLLKEAPNLLAHEDASK